MMLPRFDVGGVIGTISAPRSANCWTAARSRARMPGAQRSRVGDVSVSIVDPIRMPANGLPPGRGASGKPSGKMGACCERASRGSGPAMMPSNMATSAIDRPIGPQVSRLVLETVTPYFGTSP